MVTSIVGGREDAATETDFFTFKGKAPGKVP